MDLFHMVFTGNEQATAGFVDELVERGYSAAIDPLGAGLERELNVDVVEALGDGELGEATYASTGRGRAKVTTVEYSAGSPLDVAARHGFALRVHGWVSGPAELVDPVQVRLAELEATVARLLERSN